MSSLPRNTLRKYLFQLRVPISYKNVVSTFEAVSNDTPVPKDVTSDGVMLLKKVLQTYRTKTGRIDRQLVALERDLVEKAAEMGNNDAVALLAGEVLGSENETAEDKKHADSLLTQLMNIQHPLAYKISGDLSYNTGHVEEARRFYDLAVSHNVELSVRVECLRNVGMIRLMKKEPWEAQKAFLKAVNQAEDQSKVMDCHFYLSQILDADKERVRYHLEKAATFGLRQAFAPLGFLHLNYFGQNSVAEEWFKLGKEIGDMGCVVGLLDLYTPSRLSEAVPLLEMIQKSEQADQIIASRKDKIQLVEAFVAAQSPQTHYGGDRWA